MLATRAGSGLQLSPGTEWQHTLTPIFSQFMKSCCNLLPQLLGGSIFSLLLLAWLLRIILSQSGTSEEWQRYREGLQAQNFTRNPPDQVQGQPKKHSKIPQRKDPSRKTPDSARFQAIAPFGSTVAPLPISAPGAILYTIPLANFSNPHPSPVVGMGLEADSKTALKQTKMFRELSGQVLWQHNPNISRPTASITKLMSLLVVQEFLQQNHINLEQVRRIPSGGAASQRPFDAALAGLRTGMQLSWAQLLSYAIVASANDAIYALAILLERKAQVLTGSSKDIRGQEITHFVARMQRRATELGLSSAHFVDPDGWSEQDRISPLDVARLAAYYSQHFPEALRWHRQLQVLLPGGRLKTNTNLLLPRFPEVDGLKTGFTYEAGFNFCATAQRSGWRYIAVVMGIQAPQIIQGLQQRSAEARVLLDWGLRNFIPVPQHLQHIPVTQPASALEMALYQNLETALPQLKLQWARYRYWSPNSQPGLRSEFQTLEAPERYPDTFQLKYYWDERKLLAQMASGQHKYRGGKESRKGQGYGEFFALQDPPQLLGYIHLPPPTLALPAVPLLQWYLRRDLAKALWPLIQVLGWGKGREPFAILRVALSLQPSNTIVH